MIPQICPSYKEDHSDRTEGAAGISAAEESRKDSPENTG